MQNLIRLAVAVFALALSGCLGPPDDDVDRTEEELGTAPSAMLSAWLTAHPQVAASMVWWDRSVGWKPYPEWPAAHRTAFLAKFDAAWTGKMPTFPDPVPNLAAGTDYYATTLSIGDATAMYDALTIYGLRSELMGTLPWSLLDYSSAQLALLFDGRKLFSEMPICLDYMRSTSSPPPYSHCGDMGLAITGNSLPAPPAVTAKFIADNGVVGATRRQTIGRLLDWSRVLRHFGGSSREVSIYYWGYDGEVPLSAVMAGTDPVGLHPDFGYDVSFGHWTAGCHGTASFLREVLRVINIPVDRMLIPDTGHRTPVFVTEGLYLSHGDDVYGVGLGQSSPQYPGELLLINKVTFYDWFGKLTTAAQHYENVGRQKKVLAETWLPDSLMKLRCEDRAAGVSNRHGEVQAALWPAWTEAQLDERGFWGRLDLKIKSRGGCAAF